MAPIEESANPKVLIVGTSQFILLHLSLLPCILLFYLEKNSHPLPIGASLNRQIRSRKVPADPLNRGIVANRTRKHAQEPVIANPEDHCGV